MAYATVDDLEKRWRKLTDSEKERAEVLLGDASAFLASELSRVGKSAEDDELLQINLRVVSCAMVKRIMASAVDGNYSQISKTAGSFSEQFTVANPSGDMYLTSNERNLLGIPVKSTKAGFVMYATPSETGDSDDG